MFLIFFMQTKFKLRECKKIAKQNAKYGQWFGPFQILSAYFITIWKALKIGGG